MFRYCQNVPDPSIKTVGVNLPYRLKRRSSEFSQQCQGDKWATVGREARGCRDKSS